MRFTPILSGLVLFGAGCSPASELPPSYALPDVVVNAIAIRLGGRDSVTFTVANEGGRDAFLLRCGAGPRVLTQQLIGELWVGGVQNFMCPVAGAAVEVRLAPGERIEFGWVFDGAGRFRVSIVAGIDEDLADGKTVYSNAFDVP